MSLANTPAAAGDVDRSGERVWPKPSREKIVLLITVIVAFVFGPTLPGFASAAIAEALAVAALIASKAARTSGAS